MITWARELNDLSQAELADKINVHRNQVIKWEDGKTKPTFKQAQDIAKALHIPFGYLFLTDRPALEDPLPDLRTRRDVPLKTMSADLRETVYGVLAIQDWYREYRVEYDVPRRAFVGSMSTTNSPESVARSIRETLALDNGIREEAATRAKYLAALIEKAEASGILVMHSGIVGNNVFRPLSADEFQGFVSVDEHVPVIFINGRDYVNAKIFTLAHELAHVWIGKSGILNPDEGDIKPPRDIEGFCNAVAADVLMPKADFLRVFETLGGSFELVSDYFRVSQLAVLVRAFRLKKISRDSFYQRLEVLKRAQTAKKRGGKGDLTYADLVGIRHSPTFMDSIIKDVRVGGTLIRDAARLLHMNPSTFNKIIQTGVHQRIDGLLA